MYCPLVVDVLEPHVVAQSLSVPRFALYALAILRPVEHAPPGLLKRSTCERVSRDARTYHSGQLDGRCDVYLNDTSIAYEQQNRHDRRLTGCMHGVWAWSW